MDNISDRRLPNVATANEYFQCFSTLYISPNKLKMLIGHANAGVMTARQLAKEAGWAKFHVANLHYGLLGNDVARHLGLTLKLRAKGTPIGISALAVSAGDPDAPEFQWRIHPEVVEGLRMAGLIR